MQNEEDFLIELKNKEDREYLDYYYYIKRIERQNMIVEEQIRELEKLIERSKEENFVLEKSIKEIVSKDEKLEWVKIISKKIM